MKAPVFAMLAAGLVLAALPAFAQITEPTPEQLQGEVNVTVGQPAQPAAPAITQPSYVAPNLGLQAGDYLKVSVQPADLREYSDRKYHAVTYTVTNQQNVRVELMHGEVLNALDEARLAEEKRQSKERARKIGGRMLGLASAVPGVGFMGATSYGAHLALAHTANALSAASYVVQNTGGGDLSINGQYVTRINSVMLNPGQTFTFEAVLPVNVQPGLKLVFKDLENSRIFDLYQ